MIASRRAYGCAFGSMLLLLTALAGCSEPTASRASARTVTIGFLATTTGPRAAEGADAVRGAQLAVDVVNLSYPDIFVPLGMGTGLPSLGGATLTLITGDAKGVPEEATNQVNTLVGEKHAVAIVTCGSAEVAAAAGNQTQRLRVPLVDAASTADYLTELGMDWYFRLAPTDHMFADAVFNLVQRQLAGARNRRVALLTESGDEGLSVATILNDELARAGYQIVLRHDIVSAGADRIAVAKQLADTGAAVVLALADTGRGARDATATVAAMRRPIPIVGSGPGFAEVGSGPAPARNVLRTASWSAEFSTRNPTSRAVGELYHRKFGLSMTLAAANAFTATITLAAAIDAAGSSEPAAIRSALRQIWLPATQVIMPWDGVQFDSNGQNRLAASIIELWSAAGFRVVFPEEVANTPMTWIPGDYGQ